MATRLRLGFPASPRQLRTLILTLPSAMPKQEREIFRRRMFEGDCHRLESNGLAPAG
ncbi:Uncharacterized protein conserved in bacteria, putative virulence factor [Leclercia adecarboxylata]|uniref:Uncharacterized protein conserved in bacteria, putative virulence factor n=1 Tax=Leclercia adecarboxylata TaxID=83655 RepID=A0A4U9HVL7_9ENTR|nr:Uncharacterized protein conserved in bacteria, putative virulence factor [Leclercia adecarboxylata]